LTRLFRPAYSLVRGWRPASAREVAGGFRLVWWAPAGSGTLAGVPAAGCGPRIVASVDLVSHSVTQSTLACPGGALALTSGRVSDVKPPIRGFQITHPFGRGIHATRKAPTPCSARLASPKWPASSRAKLGRQPLTRQKQTADSRVKRAHPKRGNRAATRALDAASAVCSP